MMQRNVASIPGYRPGNEANTHSSGQVIVKDLDMFEKQNSVRSVAAKGMYTFMAIVQEMYNRS